jgi:hypothetical protein
MPVLREHGASLLVAAFAAGGHGKPALHAQVKVTQPPQTVQLATPPNGEPPGWWFAPGLYAGIYKITAHAPHQVCASISLNIPAETEAQYEIRIYCKR